MIEHEHTFQNQDQLKLFYHEWVPDNGDIRAVVFIVHGHGEHSGRYRLVAESFTQAGFACYGIDHRGHGKSGGDRAYIPDLQLAVDDLRELFEQVQTQHTDKPLLIFGHSMGTLISLMYTLQYQQNIEALALTGTAITGEELQPGWLVSLGIIAAKFIPKVQLSPPTPATMLSTDPDIASQWQSDPLTLKSMWRIGTSVAMIQAGRNIREQVHNLTLPLLLMHGGADELVPVSGSLYLQEHAQSDDITLKIYDGLRHELVNEVGREAIIREITDWLVAHS